MELFDHLRKTSFGFFVLLGLVHFIAGLMVVNGYYEKTSLLVHKVLYIPFVLTALTYGLSNAKCTLLAAGKSSKSWDYSFLALGGIVFVALLAIELLFPDAPPLTSPL